MSLTDTAAWWGAVIATLLLAWDIYKWKRNVPRLKITASPNMRISNSSEAGPYVLVEASNIGNRSTTLTHLIGIRYENRLAVLFNKPIDQFVVPSPLFGKALPLLIGPGERWMGGIDQQYIEKEVGKEGFLYCGVKDSFKSKATLARVKLN